MFEDRGKNKRILLFLLYLLVGVLIRLYYLSQFSVSPLFNIPIGPDVEEYTTWANDILAGQLLWDKVHIHSPLYPYFLALLFWIYSGVVSLFGWVRFTQLAIGLLSVVPLYFSLKIALDDDSLEKENNQCLIENRVIKGVFLFLWLCYPPLIFYMGELTSEVLLIPLLSLSIFYLYKSEQDLRLKESAVEGEESDNQLSGMKNRKLLHIAMAGLTAGLAVIAHPLVLFFLFCESLYLFILSFVRRTHDGWRNNLLRLAAFIIFAALPVTPIVVYNMMILKEPVPLQANSGFNFYLGNGAEADGTCRLRPGPEWERVHAEAEKRSAQEGVSKDQYFLNASFRFIRENPLQWLGLLSHKAVYVWNEKELTAGADLLPLRYFTSFQRDTRWAFGVVAVFALFVLLMNIGPGIYERERRRSFFYRYRHFLILLVACWGAQTLLVTSGRYRVPMLISVLVLASAGFASIISALRMRRKRAVWMIPVLLVALSIVYIPRPPFNPTSEVAEAQSLLGEALIKKGRYMEAEGMLRSAAKHQPDWSRNYNLLGLISEQDGRYDEALEYYRQAIKCDQEDPEGYLNIATLYANRKMMKMADQFFKKALGLKKATPSLYYNYALYCSDQGDINRAIKYYRATLKLDPSNIQTLNNLGTIYFQEKQMEQAIECFKTALRLQPNNPKRMVNLALAYLKNGNKDMAATMVRRAKGIAPDMPALHILSEEIKKKK